MGKKNKLNPSEHALEISKLDGRHAKEEEERERRQDKSKLKKLFAENAPNAIMKISEANDPSTLRRRSA